MAATTTITSSNAWSPDLYTFAADEVVPDALIMKASTISGTVEGDAPVVRVAYVDDAEADFVDEGADINEADLQLAEVDVATKKVAQLIRISREQWAQDGANVRLSTSARRAITRKANLAFIAQVAPTPPAVAPPAGLINIDGVLDDFAEISTDLDPLADAITAIEDNDGTASVILAAPSAWGALRKLKTADDENTTLLGAGTTDAQRMLLGLPVLTSTAVPRGTLLVVDKLAIPSAVGEVQVATSEHVFFKSDSIALRVTWRIGWNALKADRIAVLTVAGIDDESSSSSSSSSGA